VPARLLGEILDARVRSPTLLGFRVAAFEEKLCVAFVVVLSENLFREGNK
jgi:hypothetical protein